LKKDFK